MRVLSALAGAALALGYLNNAAASDGWIEPNHGQAAAGYDFVIRASDLTAIVAPDHLQLLLPTAERRTVTAAGARDGDVADLNAARHVGVRLNLVGARGDAAGRGDASTAGGVSHYFRGRDARHWVSDVPHLARARFTAVYPGIDLVYRINAGKLEYDFELAPGANPAQIRLQLEGGGDLSIGRDGALTTHIGSGELRHHAPEVFRVRDGRREPIDGAFVPRADRTIGFLVADTTQDDRVIIDPVIEFSGFVGGSGADTGALMRQASGGDYVLVGRTASVDLPGTGLGSANGEQDVFVTRLDGATGQVEWVAYIGGTGDDFGENMVLDSQDNVIVAGYTESPDYPAVNAFQATFAGSEDPASGFNWDATVFKLAANGASLAFSTYLGGTDLGGLAPDFNFGFEWLRGIAIDANDEILVVGQTAAADFPVTTTFGGRACMSTDANAQIGFVSDIIVARFAANGARLASVCIGGSERDGGRDVRIGADGSVYVGGFGRSGDLPGTAGSYQPLPFEPLRYSPFVMKLSADLTSVGYASYVGEGLMQRIAIAADGAVFGSGITYVDNFPVTPGAFQTVFGGGNINFDQVTDSFIFKLNPSGTALEYATYLGGSRDDELSALAIDGTGRAYLAGTTYSPDFPLQNALFTDIGRSFSDIETLVSGSGVQGLLYANDRPLPDFRPGLFIARNGLNQRLSLFATPATLPQDLGTETADSTAAVFFDTDGFDGPDSVLFANRFAPAHVYTVDTGTGEYIRGPDRGTPGGDSRAAAVLTGDLGLPSDVAIANYGGFNELLTTSAPEPILIGRADGNTTSVVVGSFGVAPSGESIVFGNEGQDVRLLPYAGGAVGAPVILSAAGTPVSCLAAGDLDGDGLDELVIGNAGTANQIVTFAGGVPNPPIDLGSEIDDTRSLLLVDAERDGDLDLIVGNAGPDRLYINDGVGNLVLDPRYDGNAGTTRALTGEPGEAPFIATDTSVGMVNSARRAAVAVVLDPSGSNLEFSTYLEAGGDEYVFRGLAVPQTGRMLIAGSTNAVDWPQVGRDAPYAGQVDAMFMVINLDQDADGVFDSADNCTLAANPDQRDTNGDGYGNRCDADLNNDGVVNFTDLGLLRSVFFSGDADADFDGNGVVNIGDLSILKAGFFAPPGPSGVAF